MLVDDEILDDAGRVAAADVGGLLLHAAGSARQVRRSWTLADESGVQELARGGRPRSVVVAGIGTSALAAGVLSAVAGPTSPVPVIGHHGFGLPGWVGVADVVVAVSASGSSPETLAAAEEADRRGARLLAVGASGSPLAYLAGVARAPFVPVDDGVHTAVVGSGAGSGPRAGASVVAAEPSDIRPGRAAFWSLVVPVLAAGRALGLVREGSDAVEAAARRLEEIATRCRASSESFVNPAKSLALEVAGTLPVVWGATPLTAVVADRAVAQFAANAKYPAVGGALPHPAHDQVSIFDGVFGVRAGGSVGVGGSGGAVGSGAGDLDDFFRDRVDDVEAVTRLRLVLMRDPAEEHPRASAQAAAAVALARERGVGVTELVVEGVSRLERLASLVGLVDYASVYLAFALGIEAHYTLAVTDLAATPQP